MIISIMRFLIQKFKNIDLWKKYPILNIKSISEAK